jgi:imidazolonepropionase-like amidohydrolase
MIKFVMTPLQAIQTATINAAHIFKWQENMGRIE